MPFVLSWSVLDALACECTVVASDTAPVHEVVKHEKTGLLAGFFDVDGLAAEALRVLADPPAYRHLGAAGRTLVAERYGTERARAQQLRLFRRVAG